MDFCLPSYVTDTLNRLEQHGFEAYCVGGCVRDTLLGLVPHDYDIATAAKPEDCHALFDHTVDTGVKHGTVTVVCDGHNLEITTYRTDGQYSDHRKPDSVVFVTSLRDDLARRDFTVNAMAYHPIRGLFDPFDGKTDLKNRVLRAVGNPSVRFHEDALRILRLFRFACRFNMTADPATLSAALQKVEALSLVSVERIEKELIDLLLTDHPHQADPLFQGIGLSFLGLHPIHDSLSSLAALPKDRVLRFCAFCRLTDTNPKALAVRLKSDKNLRDGADNCEQAYLALLSESVCLKELLYRYGEPAVRRALLLAKQSTNALDDILAKKEPYKTEHLCLSGRDCHAVGLTGEAIGKALYALLTFVWQDPALNCPKRLLPLLTEIADSQKPLHY